MPRGVQLPLGSPTWWTPPLRELVTASPAGGSGSGASDGDLDLAGARLLADASGMLAGSLNLSRTLNRAGHLFVPRFGSWALLGLAGARDLRCVTLSATAAGDGGDPSRLERSAERPAQGPLARVLAVGRPEVLPTVPAELRPALAPHPDLLASLVTADLPQAAAGIVVPLLAHGTPIGVLAVVRSALGPWAEREAVLLLELARRCALALDAARLYGERTHVAHVLQASLRPPRLPQLPGARIAAHYRPALEHAEIGGDFYDVHGRDDDWTLVIGDVRGKGVEAAVLTGQARQSVRTAALLDRNPAAVLGLLNAAIQSDSDADADGDGGERFVSIACARLRPAGAGRAGLRLDLATAGHPPALLLSADGGVRPLGVPGLLAGAFPDAAYEEVTAYLAPGDSCLFYTDGVLEARDASGEFGMHRLCTLLASAPGADPQVLVERVLTAVLDHVRDRAHDDIALLAVQATHESAP